MSCTNCGEKEELTHFSIKENGLKCEKCSKLDKCVIRISLETLHAIRYIVMSDLKKLFAFSIPEDSVEEMKLISKVYLEEKLEKSYKFEKIV